MLFKITQKQVGNGIGTLLASVGIPLILDAIKGKGLKGRDAVRMGKSGGAAPRIGAPPPFIGSWDNKTIGRGKKKSQKKDFKVSERYSYE